jgi:hypothetical protein
MSIDEVLMDAALDYTKPFKQTHLKEATGLHSSIIGQWLGQQIRKGDLRRRKVAGTYWYEWVND